MASTTDLTKDALAEMRDLARAETELVRHDLRTTAERMKVPAALVVGAAASALVGVELLVAALLVGMRRHPFALAAGGAALLGGGVAALAVAPRSFPKGALLRVKRSLQRAAEDVRLVKSELVD